MNWTVTSTGNDFTVMKEDFKIKKGDKFVCTSDVVMDGDSTDVAYRTGIIYKSEYDGCITDDQGHSDHIWEKFAGDIEERWSCHFQRYNEEKMCVCDVKGEAYCGCKPDKDYFQSVQEEYGKRQFESGAVRDTNKNKPFIHCLLGYTRQRFGYHMAKNASKYGEGNFLKGIPTEAYLESMDRHLAAYMEGDRSEDHLSAIMFGVNGIMLNEKREEGLPADFYFNN